MGRTISHQDEETANDIIWSKFWKRTECPSPTRAKPPIDLFFWGQKKGGVLTGGLGGEVRSETVLEQGTET